MKKIIIDENLCIGCGACCGIDPEHFDFNDNGFAICISNNNLESESLTNAIESCPTNAIKITVGDNHIEKDNASKVGCNCENCTCNPCEC